MKHKIFTPTALFLALTISCSPPSNQNTGETHSEVSGEVSGDGSIDNHNYADLGLPSGLKWATCNLGALNPEEYGDRFAWGEVSTKQSYTEDNSLTHPQKVTDRQTTPTGLRSRGIINHEGNLTPKHDAATVNWGNSWRMPSKDEFQELLDACEWTWTQRNDIEGYKVTGPNGHSIFLPASGSLVGATKPDGLGEYGCYWSSTAAKGNQFTYALYFHDYTKGGVSTLGRYDGYCIRPVTK